MENISVILPSDLVERAMQATGKRTAKAAFTALVESRKPNAAPKRSLQTSEREKPLPLSKLPKAVQASERALRQGKGKTFKTAAAAMRWLES